MRRSAALVALLTLLGSSCSSDGGGEGSSTEGGGGAAPGGLGLSGIVYADASQEPPLLAALDGDVPFEVRIGSPGFDLGAPGIVIGADTGLLLIDAEGEEREIVTEPRLATARPSFSPDGSRVAVQAFEGQPRPDGMGLAIWVVDLDTGSARKISPGRVNDESPEWIPGTNRVVYSSFDPEAGIDAHVVDVDTGEEVLVIPDGGAIHLAVSDDGARLLDPGRLRSYDLGTGEMVADLHDAVIGQLGGLGLAPDTRFEGQAGRGTFPLDGDFSPDGRSLVLDGAVAHDGGFGVALFQVALDGTGLQLLAGPFEVDPGLSNDHNFSQLNPLWR